MLLRRKSASNVSGDLFNDVSAIDGVPWALGATISARSPRQWGLQEGAASQELISVKNTLDAAPDRRSTVIESVVNYATGADRRQLT